MSPTLDLNLILVPSKQCTIRKQVDQYLLYHQQTDELHLLTVAAYQVYALCNGQRRVDDILVAVSQASGDSLDSVREPLDTFLNGLIKRGILAVEKPNV